MPGVTGIPESDLLDRSRATNDELAADLAEELCRQADQGGSGVTLIALNPEPDLMESPDHPRAASFLRQIRDMQRQSWSRGVLAVDIDADRVSPARAARERASNRRLARS